MATGQITPPEGFQLEPAQPQQPTITPPAGFQLETAPPATTADKGEDFWTGPESQLDQSLAFYKGGVKGAGETAHTLGRVLNAATGDQIKWLPTSTDQPGSLESKNVGESLGKIGESIAEFTLGDIGLKGLSIAEKLGIAHKLNEFAKESPTAAKLISAGLSMLRGGATGAVSGGLHDGKEGAEAGAVLGAGAEGLGVAGGAIKSKLFPSEAVKSQVTKDLIRKTLGSKVDADVAEELASRVNKEKFLSPMENELKLAKASIDEELPTLNKQLDDTLAKSTTQTGNAARLVNKTFDTLADQVNTGVGTEKEASIKAIDAVRKEVVAKLSNEPMDAQSINDVKRLVGDQIKKFAPPENLTTVDAQKKEAYRQAYFKLRDMVSELSPESKDINSKISRGISAQDVLEKKFPQLETPQQARDSHEGEIKTNRKKLLVKGAIGAAGAGSVYGIDKAARTFLP